MAERARVVRLAVKHAGNIPVMAGIGALRTRDVFTLAEDAEVNPSANELSETVSRRSFWTL